MLKGWSRVVESGAFSSREKLKVQGLEHPYEGGACVPVDRDPPRARTRTRLPCSQVMILTCHRKELPRVTRTVSRRTLPLLQITWI